VGEKFYLGSLLDFHTFVKALAGKEFKCIWRACYLSIGIFPLQKRGEYFILFLNVSPLLCLPMTPTGYYKEKMRKFLFFSQCYPTPFISDR
jgi:hypothetical protein